MVVSKENNIRAFSFGCDETGPAEWTDRTSKEVRIVNVMKKYSTCFSLFVDVVRIVNQRAGEIFGEKELNGRQLRLRNETDTCRFT